MKSGERLAHVIEETILEQRLPAGANLGSESELVARYGVSRPVFREAVRLVEHEGLAVMRKGPSGGLTVAEPDHVAVTHGAAVWLRRNEATLDELFATREIIEPACALRAAERSDPEARVRLMALLAEQGRLASTGEFEAYNCCVLEFHQLIAELSGNKVAWLFMQALSELTIAFAGAPSYSAEELDETDNAHRLIADAVISGDGPLASHRMLVHMRASRQFGEHLHSS